MVSQICEANRYMSSDETGFEIRDSTVVAEETEAPLWLVSRCDEPEEESARWLFLSDTGTDRSSEELRGAASVSRVVVETLCAGKLRRRQGQ
jgi:hypothetical protein